MKPTESEARCWAVRLERRRRRLAGAARLGRVGAKRGRTCRRIRADWAFQNRIVPSTPAEATVAPSGETSTERIASRWPRSPADAGGEGGVDGVRMGWGGRCGWGCGWGVDEGVDGVRIGCGWGADEVRMGVDGVWIGCVAPWVRVGRAPPKTARHCRAATCQSRTDSSREHESSSSGRVGRNRSSWIAPPWPCSTARTRFSCASNT